MTDIRVAITIGLAGFDHPQFQLDCNLSRRNCFYSFFSALPNLTENDEVQLLTHSFWHYCKVFQVQEAVNQKTRMNKLQFLSVFDEVKLKYDKLFDFSQKKITCY